MSVVKVSDHALLRFLEQAGELDVEQLRHQLEAALDRSARAAERIGAKNYLISSGKNAFLVRHNDDQPVVVTVLRRKSPGVAARAFNRSGKKRR